MSPADHLSADDLHYSPFSMLSIADPSFQYSADELYWKKTGDN